MNSYSCSVRHAHDIVLCRLCELLFAESRLLDGLNSLGVEPSAHSPLLAMPVHRSESSTVVLDVRSRAVVVSWQITVKCQFSHIFFPTVC